MENVIIKKCEKCKIDFNAYSKWKVKRFCSRECGNSRIWTNEDKIKRSLSAKNSNKVIKSKCVVRKCACGNDFEVLSYKSKKYCSIACGKKFREKYKKSSNFGGYRLGSGRSKSGYYKGIYCGSTYELCWVIYNLDHNIAFKRFPFLLEKNGIKYYPDFLLEDGRTIVEIKGYEQKEKVEAKTKVAEFFGYEVIVLRKEDLQYIFDYVEEKYSKKFHELYDGYKPKYKQFCHCCNSEFFKDKELKTDICFCSRSCAGRYQSSINKRK